MALKEVMDRNNVKGKDLADAVGVQAETVSRWRSKVQAIDGANLVRLLDYLRRLEPALQASDLLPTAEPAAVSEGK